MSDIEFNQHEKATMVAKLQKYFEAELDQTIGQFDAEFLLDFFSDNIGAYYYNRGLTDARAIFEDQIAALDDALYANEKPVD